MNSWEFVDAMSQTANLAAALQPRKNLVNGGTSAKANTSENSGPGTCLAGGIETNRRVTSTSTVICFCTSSPERSTSRSPLRETIGRCPSPVKLRWP
jgi:hypothetical protein